MMNRDASGIWYDSWLRRFLVKSSQSEPKTLPRLTHRPKKLTTIPRRCGGATSTVYTFDMATKKPLEIPRRIRPA